MPNHPNNKYPVKLKKYQMVLLMKCFNLNNSKKTLRINFFIDLFKSLNCRGSLENTFIISIYPFSQNLTIQLDIINTIG